MNRDNLNTLITHLKALRDAGRHHKFNMSEWITHPDAGGGFHTIGRLEVQLPKGTVINAFECKTVACLAGHCALLGGAETYDHIESFAAKWLGLGYNDARQLFLGRWGRRFYNHVPLHEVTLDEAIEHLETL